MFSRTPTRPLLITPSASPPPQPSSSKNELPSPSKRQRTSSRSSSVIRSVSVAESTLDFSKEREASVARMLGTWSQLAERYSRRLDDDDIVDIRTGEIVKDNGFWKATRRFNFGEALQREEAGDSVDEDSEDDEGIDELDAFEGGRNYIEDGFAKDLQQKLLTHAERDAATDLDEFLEAEQRRKEEYGSDVEDEDELELPLKHHRVARSPLSTTSDSNGEEESSDTNDQDALSSYAPESFWEDQESEGDYDEDDELDNWDPIEGSKVIPVGDYDSSPQADASKFDGKDVQVPVSTSSKRPAPPLQIYTPPPSHSLANSSDSDPVVSPCFLSADHTPGSSYVYEAKSISPPSSPSKSRPRKAQSIGPQTPAVEIIEITDDESPGLPSKPTKSISPSPSPSPRPPVRNRRQSIVPQVVITTLPPRPTQIKRNGVTTTPTTPNTSGNTASTKRAQKHTAPGTSVQPTQSAKSVKKAVIPKPLVKPSQPAKVANKVAALGTLSSPTTPARPTKKVASSTMPAKPPSARNLAQKPRKTDVNTKTKTKTKTAVPLTVASDPHSDDDHAVPESNLLHQRASPEAADPPATPPSHARSSIELQASKLPLTKRKNRKRKRSSSAHEVVDPIKAQSDLSLSSQRAASRGRVRASSAAPRRSYRRSLSRSKYLSDDDDHSSSNEETGYKRPPPRCASVSTTPRMQPPYIPHTPTPHSGAYPPIVDARAQHIITQAMHQLAALFWTPSHPVSANPLYPYATPSHTYSSVGPSFMHSTPDHPHPYPFTFDPSLSAASLPPSSPEPPSSPVKPRERRKSLVPRSHSRGRKVSFRADEKDAESSEDEELESAPRNNNVTGNDSASSERSPSPPRLKRKGKGKEREQVGSRHMASSGSGHEDDESIPGRSNVKNTRAEPASIQKPRVGRSTKDSTITSGSSDPRSPKKPSKYRGKKGGSSAPL